MSSKRKTNAKGRNPNGVQRVVIVRRALLHSPQFSALSLASRALFWELHAIYNGTNNGALFLSCKDAGDRLGLADLKAVRAAFDELSALGFITETIGASFALKAGAISRARAWRLNWIDRYGHCMGPDCVPPLEFGTLSATQKRRVERRSRTLTRYLGHYQQGKFAVEDTFILEVRAACSSADAVVSSTTRASENLGNPPFGTKEKSTQYIDYHGEAGGA